MLERLLKLANELDAAGLTKEADLADKIAQMDEWDDTVGWGGEDSLEGFGDEEFSEELADEDDAMLAEEQGEVGSVEAIVTQLEAMKGMVEEGLMEESQLAEIQSQVEALQNLFLGGGPSMITGEEPQPAQAWGEPGQEIPVAEASRKRRMGRILEKLS